MLRDGTEVRGQVLDVRTGQSVTVRTSAGELRVLAWAEISAASGPGFRAALMRAERGSVSSDVTGSYATGSPGVSSVMGGTGAQSAREIDDMLGGSVLRPQTYLRPRPGTVPVVIESDGDPLTVGVIVAVPLSEAQGLYGTSGGNYGLGLSTSYGIGYGTGYGGFGTGMGMGMGSPYFAGAAYGMPLTTRLTLCRTPCTVHLRPGMHALYIGGPTRRESEETVDVRGPGMRLRYHSASRTAHALGQTFLWLGAGAVVLGVLLLVDGAARCGGAGCDRTLSLGLLIGGGLALGVGLPLVLVNRTGLVNEREVERARQRSARGGFTVAAMPVAGGGVIAGVVGMF